MKSSQAAGDPFLPRKVRPLDKVVVDASVEPVWMKSFFLLAVTWRDAVILKNLNLLQLFPPRPDNTCTVRVRHPAMPCNLLAHVDSPESSVQHCKCGRRLGGDGKSQPHVRLCEEPSSVSWIWCLSSHVVLLFYPERKDLDPGFIEFLHLRFRQDESIRS